MLMTMNSDQIVWLSVMLIAVIGLAISAFLHFYLKNKRNRQSFGLINRESENFWTFTKKNFWNFTALVFLVMVIVSAIQLAQSSS